MILTKTFATITVAWHERKAIWERMLDNARQIQAFALILLCVMTVCVIGARVKLAHDMQIEAQQTAAAEEMRLSAEKQEAIRAASIAAEQAKVEEEKAAARSQREAVARVLYGTALHHSADAQRAVCWCIINRVESSLYPDTVEAVCEQESQWMGYSPENPIISSLYDVADEVISGWESGGYRAISPDYLFLTWTRDEIVLKTTFTDGKNTHYWRVS